MGGWVGGQGLFEDGTDEGEGAVEEGGQQGGVPVEEAVVLGWPA